MGNSSRRAAGLATKRADAVAPLFEASKVWLPEYASWVAEWIEEHVAFPRAAHDDQMDTTSMGLARLRGATGGGNIPMATAGELQGSGFGTTDAVVEGILQRIAALRDAKEQAEQGEGAGTPEGTEPEHFMEAQLQHMAGLGRMLGDLNRWGGPHWG